MTELSVVGGGFGLGARPAMAARVRALGPPVTDPVVVIHLFLFLRGSS